tara:strand:+ start:651 stop:1784 length:1134 start_codon:yes stop_codon:yes gene_type:complete
MNKFEFISHLLENRKMNSVQKERFLKLASKEIGLDRPSNEELWEEIEKIKQQLKIKDKGSEIIKVENSSSKLKGKQKEVHEPNPKHVADFMSLFNQREGLKYLTHDYDENTEFDIDEFLLSAHEVFEKETKKLNIPTSLWRIVAQFAFDSERTEWTSISEDYKKSMPITMGWATKELKDWSKQNYLHPIRNEAHKKIIDDFKRITRIESTNLEKLIDATIESNFKNEIEKFEIKKIDLSKADFYSHVGFLKIAFEIIFEEIKKHSDSSEKKKITIEYKRATSDDGYFLRKILITHHKSFPSKELGVILVEFKEKGNIGKIRKKLEGYCHWSVETMIDDVPTKINILKEKKTPEHEIIKCEDEELPKGFTHILTFYYK